MNQRKYELMEAHLKGDLTVLDLIDRIVELEDPMRRQECMKNIKHAYEVQSCVMVTRLDAQKVLNALEDGAKRYTRVSVADYYDLVGIGAMYTDNAYGWSADSLNRAAIIPFRKGYIIKFPPVEVI